MTSVFQPLLRGPTGNINWERRGTHGTLEGSGNNFRLHHERSRIILNRSYINILLIFLPLAIASDAAGWTASIIFAFNFLALIPLENVLNNFAETLFLPLGESAGAVLSLSLPHMLPMMIGITSIANGNIRLAQTFVLGSLLSNHLFGLGACFVLSSFLQLEPSFPTTGTNTEACLLYLIGTPIAMCKLLSPELLYKAFGANSNSEEAILFLSRGSAIVFLILYMSFLVFRLRTHRFMWQEEEADSVENDGLQYHYILPRFWPVHFFSFILTFALMILCTRNLVCSVVGVVEGSHVTLTFTGMILVPIITHVTKYIKTFVIAYDRHPEIAVAMTLGSSVDVAFFTLPLLILIGWAIGQPMTMEFEMLEVVITILSILVMAGLVMDGKSNYLEGAMSLGLYGIIVLTYAINPDPPNAT